MASSHIVDFRWDAGGRFEHKADIPPGKFVEVCGPLKSGQQVAWSFRTTAATRFNVHYHQGKDTVYPTQLKGVKEAAQTLVVKAEEVHCWMWTNEAKAATGLVMSLSLKP